ncbi:MAG: transposase [Hyphomicrobium sp.]|uniref:IS66 family insertion sequence element accessory protein TnpA n=1 Tax=Hyphomicrobium sp. TaxID=82 RepID=UPI0025C31AB3|nr:transposase [Hyphomicrobium sp.]MBZ0211069.1 transposase [Hyphomicrobium sp.]
MASETGAWTRQGETFWRAHHEAWKRSDLNQRQYCEAEGIPLKAFGNWRAIFKAEPQPPERKLLYRRRELSPLFSPPFSPTLSPPLSPMAYPSSSQGRPIVARPREGHRRRFSEADKRRIVEEALRPGAGIAEMARCYGIDRRVLRRWKQELAATPASTFVTVRITDDTLSGPAPAAAEAMS